MNWQINKLVKSLLQKETLEQCSLQELEQFADRNPYFGAAQLLLTKKLQIENSERYEEQLQKTFLYFHNPLWVEQLLNETGNAQVFAPEKKEVAIDKPVIIEQIEIPVGIAEEIKEPEPVVVDQPEIPAVIAEEIKDPEPVIIDQPETPAVLAEEIKESEPAVVDQPEIPAIIAEEIKDPEPIHSFSAIQPEEKVENVVHQPVFLTETPEPLVEKLSPKIEAADDQKAELLFEPFYTVDYFASQGIKFREEEKPADKFGQQLKSFTDWLKTMKKLPVSEIVKTGEVYTETSASVEKNVAQMAEHSLEEREVLTEAMAEVWEKQGNLVKAIEVYSKLSLIYPSKSTYFAAKMEDLKKTN